MRTLILIVFVSMAAIVPSGAITKGTYYYKMSDTEHDALEESDKSNMARTTYYYLSKTPATWLEAFAVCDKMGGKLVTPMNPLLDDQLRKFLVGEFIYDKIWTGARVSIPDSKNNRHWFWETANMEFYWTNFHSYSSKCALKEEDYCLSASTHIEDVTWGWCRHPCSEKLTFICEFTPTDPTIPITCGPTISTTEMHNTTEMHTTTEMRTTTTSTTERTGFECPAPDGLHLDPMDCGMFYTCEMSQPIAHQSCPAGLHWNDALKYCDYPHNVQCPW